MIRQLTIFCEDEVVITVHFGSVCGEDGENLLSYELTRGGKRLEYSHFANDDNMYRLLSHSIDELSLVRPWKQLDTRRVVRDSSLLNRFICDPVTDVDFFQTQRWLEICRAVGPTMEATVSAAFRPLVAPPREAEPSLSVARNKHQSP